MIKTIILNFLKRLNRQNGGSERERNIYVKLIKLEKSNPEHPWSVAFAQAEEEMEEIEENEQKALA
jgi:hypothetical protein